MIETDWSDIYQNETYQTELKRLLDMITHSLGQENYLDQNTPFVWAAADLGAILRYFSSNIPGVKDIDETPFLNLISQEVGNQLPGTQEIPLVEWIRENKSWNGHKSPVPIFTFIGDLIGSPIEIDYPSDLIFKLDSTRSCLDGAFSLGGPLPFKQSKLARIEDGFIWGIWTYIVKVLEFQNVKSYSDLLTLLDAVHPAGLLRIIELYDNYLAGQDDTQATVGINDTVTDNFVPVQLGTGMDAGFKLDSLHSLLSGTRRSTFNIFPT
jgi:hypothetical protein